jgi:hypothetical protein
MKRRGRANTYPVNWEVIRRGPIWNGDVEIANDLTIPLSGFVTATFQDAVAIMSIGAEK